MWWWWVIIFFLRNKYQIQNHALTHYHNIQYPKHLSNYFLFSSLIFPNLQILQDPSISETSQKPQFVKLSPSCSCADGGQLHSASEPLLTVGIGLFKIRIEQQAMLRILTWLYSMLDFTPSLSQSTLWLRFFFNLLCFAVLLNVFCGKSY